MKARLRTIGAVCILTGCAEVSDPEGRVASAIVGGVASDPAQNAAVLVVQYDALRGGAASGCTGTLLAPNLVLTARHCVSVTEETAACAADGKPISGGAVDRDYAASSIYVFGGNARPDFLSGNVQFARGQAILTTGAMTICDADIALVLLDRTPEGAITAPIRLDAPPFVGEKVTVVGWGVSDSDPNPRGRLQRADVAVTDTGSTTGVGPHEFRVGEATCKGDSGGPAFAASGAVIGALSRGGRSTVAGAEGCLGADNVFSSTSGHAEFLRAGFAKAGQRPWLEGEPNPLLASASEPSAESCSLTTSRRGSPMLLIGLLGVYAFRLRTRKDEASRLAKTG